MIITVPKPFTEILQNLSTYKNIYVIGCAACATKCQTGGEEAIKKTVNDLEQNGKKVTGSIILDTPCDIRVAKKDLKNISSQDDTQAVLILACGAGVQSVEKVLDKPIIPGLNPVFTGTTERIGIYNEYCVLCGECLLDKTGGICPIARCAKRLLNGPCGGVINGKCEVNQENDCAWSLIIEKLKKTKNGLNEIKKNIAPRSNSKPRKINNKR